MLAQATNYPPLPTWSQDMANSDYGSFEHMGPGELEGLAASSAPFPDFDLPPTRTSSNRDWKNARNSVIDDNRSYPSVGPSSNNSQSTPDQTVRICPILAGLGSECDLDICGPVPLCSNLAVPEIEDCGFLPPQVVSHDTSIGQDRLGHIDPIVAMNRPEQHQVVAVREETGGTTKKVQKSKKMHSLVERRYRENLNTKFTQLHQQLQYTRPRFENNIQTAQGEVRTAEADTQVRKSAVLTDAILYINQAEGEMRHMTNEIEVLNTRMVALQKLVNCQDCSVLKQMSSLRLQAPM